MEEKKIPDLTEAELRNVFGPSDDEIQQKVSQQLKTFDLTAINTADDVRKVIFRIHGFGSEEALLAREILRRLDREFVVKVAEEFLYNGEPEMRCRAAKTLCHLNPKYSQLLLPLLQDSNKDVRQYMCDLLHDFGDDSAVVSLVQVVKSDKDVGVRVHATAALGQLGDKSVLAVLEQIRDHDKEYDFHRFSPSDVAREAIATILSKQ